MCSSGTDSALILYLKKKRQTLRYDIQVYLPHKRRIVSRALDVFPALRWKTWLEYLLCFRLDQHLDYSSFRFVITLLGSGCVKCCVIAIYHDKNWRKKLPSTKGQQRIETESFHRLIWLLSKWSKWIAPTVVLSRHSFHAASSSCGVKRDYAVNTIALFTMFTFLLFLS